MKKKILITGAGGFLGSQLVGRLKNDQEYELITSYSKTETTIQGKNIKSLSLDLLEEKSWNVLENEKPDIVVHCAAVLPNKKTGKDVSTLNRILDDNFMFFCHKNNSIAVYPSGTLVYGFSNELCNEKTPFNGNSHYIKEKINTERKLFSLKELSYFIFRISAPYGPSQNTKTVIRIFIENAINEKNIVLFGSGKRQQDFTYIDDVINAFVIAFNSDKYGVYNIASGNSISMSELAKLIKGLVKSKSNILNNITEDPQEAYRAYINIGKAKKNLGWSPVYDIKKGLRKYIPFAIGEQKC